MDSTHRIVPELEKSLERQERAFHWVRQLCDGPGRLAGSRGEARAVDLVEGWLRELGFEQITTRPCVAAPSAGVSLALHLVLAGVGCAWGGVGGLVLAGAAAWSFRRGLARGASPLARWLSRPRSLSLVARAGAAAPRRRVVLASALGSGRSAALFSERSRDWLRHRLGLDDRPWVLTETWPKWGLTAAVLVCAASALGADGVLLNAVRAAAALGLAAGAAAGLQWAWAAPSPGANASGSGLAALLTAGEQLAAQLPPDVELWCVAAGGDARGERGLASLLDLHPEWCEETTAVVHFSAVGSGELHYARSEGSERRTVHPPMLAELARRVAASGAFGSVTPTHFGGETGGAALGRRGAQVLSLVCLDASGTPRHLDQREDRPESLDLETVVRAADFGCSVVSAHWRGDAEPLAYV